ncbi:hepatitis A virus cellular receptor 1 homolog isoform X2 [Labrus bergylta]|uniref:hepatitis A virus cellular receptor 1 homolog isoform X2 n=1 Tax=Labrus bergylta TaxID=56723 RepID=UPI0033133D1F
MNELKWIQTSLLLTALLQFAAAVVVKGVTFRVGEDATLSCQTVIQGQQKCKYTTWFLDLGNNAAVELVVYGQVRRNSRVKSDRLRVTEDCSLVIKKIREEDAGRYECLQYISGRRTGDVTRVLLSVNKSDDARETTRPPTTRPPPTTTRPPPTTTRPPPPPTTTTTTGQHGDCTGSSDLDLVMLALRVAELLLITVITVLLFRARGNQRPPDDITVYYHGDEGSVNYENVGEPSASVRLH